MSILPAEKLREAFHRERGRLMTDAAELPMREGFSLLSHIVRAIRDTGFDIEMTLHPYPAWAAFNMFKGDNKTVPVAGCIRMAEVDLYFALCTRLDNKPCKILALTWSDIGYDDTENPHGRTYDLNKKDDVTEIQRGLMHRLGAVDALNEIDAKNGNMLAHNRLKNNTLKKGRS
jgi:hypothetical protein